ncbi:hypothetical protein NQD34_013830 [Periophthalmus magnuspinnatus]|nr:hypothetical protein NQD34_013830 [Periophthalmus magnuspinnatus]
MGQNMRSFSVARKWISQPSKLTTATNALPKMCCCNHGDLKTTTYRHDFTEWTLYRSEPYKPRNHLKVFQGMTLDDGNKIPPIENQTSYRCSFVPHAVQPNTRQDKPRNRSGGVRLGGPSSCVHCESESYPGSVPRKKNATLPSFERDYTNRFLTTTHADYVQHALQRRSPIKPARKSSHATDSPVVNGTTTMRDAFKPWDLQPRTVPRLNDGRKVGGGSLDQISFLMRDGNCCHGNRKDNSADNGTMGFEYRRATWTGSEMDKDQAQMVQRPPAETNQLVQAINM